MVMFKIIAFWILSFDYVEIKAQGRIFSLSSRLVNQLLITLSITYQMFPDSLPMVLQALNTAKNSGYLMKSATQSQQAFIITIIV